MKTWLLSGTAIVAVSVAAIPANAAEKIKLGLGGYFNAYIATATQSDGAGEPGANKADFGIGREGEIYFTGSTVLDNGLKASVVVQLEAETSADQIDESYIVFSGSFGHLHIGSDDDVPEKFAIGAPGVVSGFGVNDPTMMPLSGGDNSADVNVTEVSISGDQDKLIYFTPRINGFVFGVSYAPNAQEEKTTALPANNTAGTQSQVVAAAINYEGEFGDVSFAATGAYAKSSLEVASATVTDDQRIWGLGASVGYSGFTVAGAYRKNNQGMTGNNDRTDWNLGVAYEQDAWGVSLGYGRTDVEQGSASGEDTLDVYEVGVNYVLGPGVQVGATISRWEWDDNLSAAASENSATLFTFGTRLDF